MSTTRFLTLLLAVVVSSGASVAIGFLIVWRRLERMFDRALNHGGSLDTGNREARTRASESVSLATRAVEATKALTNRVEKVEGRLTRMEDRAPFRPLGGTATMEGA